MHHNDIENLIVALTRAVDFLLRQAKLIDFNATVEAVKLLDELRDTVKRTEGVTVVCPHGVTKSDTSWCEQCKDDLAAGFQVMSDLQQSQPQEPKGTP